VTTESREIVMGTTKALEELLANFIHDKAAGRRTCRLAFRDDVAAAVAAAPARASRGPVVGKLCAVLGSPCLLCGDAEPLLVGAFCPGPEKDEFAFFSVCCRCALAHSTGKQLEERVLREWRAHEDN
jgi:hypothetical protein